MVRRKAISSRSPLHTESVHVQAPEIHVSAVQCPQRNTEGGWADQGNLIRIDTPAPSTLSIIFVGALHQDSVTEVELLPLLELLVAHPL